MSFLLTLSLTLFWEKADNIKNGGYYILIGSNVNTRKTNTRKSNTSYE